jgi:hypothetical protein
MRNRNLANTYISHIAGSNSILPARFLVREYNSKKDVERAITTSNPELRGGAGKGGSIRLQPVNKIEDKEQFTANFLKTLEDINLTIVGDIIKPGDVDSPSSKFPSYRVKDEDNNEFIITLGGGSFSNVGMNYERELLKELKYYFDNREDGAEKPLFLVKLENALDVEFGGLSEEHTFSRRVKRPLSSKGPEDRGDEISDITLIDEDDKKYYISLKAIGGKTVSNAGAKGMFDMIDGNIEFVNKEKNAIGKEIMDAGDVNIRAVLRGLDDYKNKNQSVEYLTKKHDVTENADIKKLTKFLGSAFDYGYIYVKQKDIKNNLEIADITDEDKLNEFLGDITSVYVKYPYYINDLKSRKYISININTDKGNYSFDIRNASGGFLPNQINLVRHGSAKDIVNMKANIAALGRGSANIENLL